MFPTLAILHATFGHQWRILISLNEQLEYLAGDAWTVFRVHFAVVTRMQWRPWLHQMQLTTIFLEL